MEILASSGITLWLSFIFWLISWCRREGKKSREAKKATFEECDARDAWMEWWMKNCRSNKALKSRECQVMARRVILAKIEWQRTHPNIQGSDPFDGFVLVPKS